MCTTVVLSVPNLKIYMVKIQYKRMGLDLVSSSSPPGNECNDAMQPAITNKHGHWLVIDSIYASTTEVGGKKSSKFGAKPKTNHC